MRWRRWWMLPHGYRRMILASNSWEMRLWWWLDHQLARITPGRCTACPGRRGKHKMRCSIGGAQQIQLSVRVRRAHEDK